MNRQQQKEIGSLLPPFPIWEVALNNNMHAGGPDRTIPNLGLNERASSGSARATCAVSPGPTLKILVRGLESDERQLLDGLVRVSLRRSPRLELLQDHEATQADVVLISAADAIAVKWVQTQPWFHQKVVIWIGTTGPVAAGHMSIRRPVQWSILPSLLARAMEQGPGSVHASRPTPLSSAHSTLNSGLAPSPSLPSTLGSTGASSGIGITTRTGSSAILVVDDSLAIRNHLRSLLETAGFAVSLADSVESANNMIGQRPFDCVLMDVLMPGLDGYEGCRQIKSAVRGARTLPVIMLTSKSSPFDRIRGKMAGCDAYLTKPVDPQQLGEVLSQHLQA
jgi:two-component system cell cycle response regulator